MLCAVTNETNRCNPAQAAEEGDLAISDCMQHLKINATHNDGFNPWPPEHMMFRNGSWCDAWWIPPHQHCPPTPKAISFHYIPPEDAKVLYYLSYRFRHRAASES